MMRAQKLTRRVLALFLFAGFAGCAATPDRTAPIPAWRPATIAVEAASTPDDDSRLQVDVLALADDARARLLAQLDAADERERLRQLVDLMQSPQRLGLRYTATATGTAMETLRSGEGNCLSLTALFVATARAAGLDARFQDVELLPTWRQDGDVFVAERHINAVVTIDGDPLIVDFLAQPAGATTRTRAIEDAEMTAQYLNNIGVERLAAGHTELAYRFFRRSIELAPTADYLWLNLGVALSRNGQRDDAEAAYRHAVRLAPGDVIALSNLAALYEADGRGELARSALAKVERLRLGNPYYRYWLAERNFRGGDYAGAASELRAALALKPGEGAFHFALARAYAKSGAWSDTERSFSDAQRLTTDASVRATYEAHYRDWIAAKSAAP